MTTEIDPNIFWPGVLGVNPVSIRGWNQGWSRTFSALPSFDLFITELDRDATPVAHATLATEKALLTQSLPGRRFRVRGSVSTSMGYAVDSFVVTVIEELAEEEYNPAIYRGNRSSCIGVRPRVSDFPILRKMEVDTMMLSLDYDTRDTVFDEILTRPGDLDVLWDDDLYPPAWMAPGRNPTLIGPLSQVVSIVSDQIHSDV